MKQIYCFEEKEPPRLSQVDLLEILQKKRRSRQAALIVLASVLYGICIGAASVVIYSSYPLISIICLGYLGFSAICGGAIALSFTRKRRNALC